MFRTRSPFAFPALALGAGIWLAGCSDTPAEDAAPQEEVDAPDQLGEYAIGHDEFTVVDSARGDRAIPVDVWYPVAPADASGARTKYSLSGEIGLESKVAFEAPPALQASALPLLVFSHGYGGINTQSTSLMETLASHGFVVASPEHTGNVQGSLTDSFDDAAANRVPDVSAVIDAMLERSADSVDLMHGRLESGPIGVAGHSFGGMTAVGVAAGWAGASADSRVQAIAPISAVIDGKLQGATRDTPNAGFTEEALGGVDVPVLLLGGTKDTSVPIENNQLAFDQMTGAPVVYKVDVIGANHTHFANVCDIGDLLIGMGFEQDKWSTLGAEALIAPYEATCTDEVFAIDEAIRLQNLYVVAFFKRHLLGLNGYGQYLTAEYADGEPDIAFGSRRAAE